MLFCLQRLFVLGLSLSYNWDSHYPEQYDALIGVCVKDWPDFNDDGETTKRGIVEVIEK